MCRAIWCAVLSWNLVCAACSWGADEEFRIDKLNGPAQFEFIGCESFRPDELARALIGDPKMIVARQPDQSLAALLRLIDSRLLEGYLSCGFPDAKTAADLNTENNRIVVRITEGPSYVWGDVRINGNRAISSADLQSWLSEKHPRGPRAAVVIDTKTDDQSPMDANDTKKPRRGDYSGTVVRGKPAWFSESGRAILKTSIQQGCEDQGCFDARFRVEVLRDAKSNEAQLRVEFDDEGPVATLQDVEFVGLKRHTPDEVLSELSLQRGSSAKGLHAGDIERQLAASGRFVLQKVTLHHTSDAPSDLRLKIDVTEYELAPKLSEPLSRRAEILQRFALWAEQFPNQPRDLVCRWTASFDPASVNRPLILRDAIGLRGVIALSPRRGLLASIDLTKSDGQPQPLFSAMFASGRIAMWLPQQNSRFDISTSKGLEELFQANRFTLPIIFSGVNLPGQKDNRKWALGFGTTTNRRSDQSPFEVKFELPVVVAFNKFDTPNWKESWDDGSLLLTYNEVRLKIDAETGQFMEGRIGDGSSSAEIQVGEGLFDEEYARYDRLSLDVPNAFDQKTPWNSCCRFVLAVIADAKKHLRDVIPGAAAAPVADEETDSAEPAPEFLSDPKRLSLLTQFVSGLFEKDISHWITPGRDRPSFWIPSDQTGPQKHPYESMAPITMVAVDELVGKDSWAWKVGRQAALLMLGESKAAHREMWLQLLSPTTGPLACWTSSCALGLVAPNWQKLAADVGRRRLDRTSFQRDVEGLLLQGGRMQCASERFARELHTFSDEEIAIAIHSLLDEKPANSLHRQWRRWIRDEELPDAELLPMLLVSLWKPLFQDKLDGMLIARQNIGGMNLTANVVRYLNQAEGKVAKTVSIPETSKSLETDDATAAPTPKTTYSESDFLRSLIKPDTTDSLLFRKAPPQTMPDSKDKSKNPEFLPSLAP